MLYWLSGLTRWSAIDITVVAPSADDALEAEDFSKSFTDKICQIRKETDGAPETDYACNHGSPAAASFNRRPPNSSRT